MLRGQNNYKQNNALFDMCKRGQATIFIIIAIAVVGIILVLALFPGTLRFFGGEEVPPSVYLGDCVEDDIREAVDLLSMNGGYLNPEGTIEYQGDEYKYLCYTSQYYETCAIQQPFIKNNFEAELEEIIRPKAEECARKLVQEFESRGYDVQAGETDANVTIIPGKIRTDIYVDMTVTNEGVSQEVEGYSASMESEIYELLFVSQSIVDYEAEFGDSNTEDYLTYYPDISIEKTKLSDGSTIYKVSNVVTDEEFRFASRSLAWPPGYGIE